MNNLKKEALKLHKDLKGKIEITCKSEVNSLEQLSLLYSPGVAEPCLEIEEDPNKIYDYTWVSNTVAVISNGTAVLGLGDIGAKASLPVMEGKAMLFKAFSDVNAVPIIVDNKDIEEVISTIKNIAHSFGGINLEDIKAPECFEIENRLKKELDIPVFHDDQHGTAIVVIAGLINAAKVLDKDINELNVVVSGTGAAGTSIIKMLNALGVKSILAANRQGIINKTHIENYDKHIQDIADCLSEANERKTIQEAMIGADVFIGVSAANIINQDDIRNMNDNAIVFALANPNPEIPYNDAIQAGASIVGTGRSDYPNQVNNVLAFPGIFKGALSVKAREINEEMKLAAAYAIASMIQDKDLNSTNILPKALNKDVANIVAEKVIEAAIKSNVIKGESKNE